MALKPNEFPQRVALDGTEEIYTQTNDVSEKFTLNEVEAHMGIPSILADIETNSNNIEINADEIETLEKTVDFLNTTIISFRVENYANNAAAIAGGMTTSQVYLNTTTNRLTVVVPDLGEAN